jgi:O-antigen/teichoic acid export membrane protein
MLPICILLGAFSKLVLNTWLGQEYALNSFRVMQVMLVAILINGISMIPFSLIQGIGKPDITAKFHIIEFFIYVPLLWLFIKEWGVLGAAVAWLARVALDLLLLFGYVQRILLPRLAGAELGQAQSPLDS